MHTFMHSCTVAVLCCIISAVKGHLFTTAKIINNSEHCSKTLNHMGLLNNEQGNFISIYQGKFAQRVPEGTPGSVTRENKIGKMVTERYYDSFTAKLIGIKTQDGSYGKQWYFSFKDKNEVYILALPYDGSMAEAFLKMLPNLDVTKEMKLTPSVKEVDGKTQSSLFINQDGAAIKHAFTRDVPNGMPEKEPVTINGKAMLDAGKRLAFFEEMVARDIIPKLPTQEATAPSVQSPANGLSLDEVFGDEPNAEEDAPF